MYSEKRTDYQYVPDIDFRSIKRAQRDVNPEEIPGYTYLEGRRSKPKERPVHKKRPWGYSIAAILFIIFVFFVVIPSSQGELYFLIMQSDSMAPEINVGDVVVTAVVKPQDIQIGDVITFEQFLTADEERSITHRVVGIIRDSGIILFETKGDANPESDQVMVDSSEVVGRTVLTIPYLGHLPSFVRSPLGFVTLFLFPGIIIIGEVRSRIKRKRLALKDASN